MKSVKFLPVILFLVVGKLRAIPLPAESEPSTSTTTSEPDFTPPSLIVLPDRNEAGNDQDEESPPDGEGVSHPHKRHRPTPSPAELEERRVEFIKALGGGEDSAPVLLSSLQGLGSLATDVVSLLGSNANETFGPLRDARQRARDNFPNFGTQVNNVLRNGRDYSRRAYRALVKNTRVKMTNALRFMLQAVTRLASTVGGLYQVLVSLLDVATRGVNSGARVGARLLSSGSNFTISAIAKTSQVVRNLAESGLLVKPANQAVMVGRGLAKGLQEDLFDKVEWAQEGLNSKLELARDLAPNFLLRAHENARNLPTESSATSYGPPPPSDPIIGGYSKLHDGDHTDDEQALLSLASVAAEIMQRGGREVDKDMMKKMNETTTATSTTEPSKSTTTATSTTEPSKSTTTSTKASDDDKPSSSSLTPGTSSTTPMSPTPGENKDEEDSPPAVNQTLLNDIFGLQDEVDKLKQTNNSTASTDSDKKS